MGGEASGSGRFRVGRSVWRGRYKRSVSGGGQVIVCSMFVPFDAGEIPKTTFSIFKSRRKSEIKV